MQCRRGTGPRVLAVPLPPGGQRPNGDPYVLLARYVAGKQVGTRQEKFVAHGPPISRRRNKMERENTATEKDLALAPNEFALVMDETTGVVKTYTGPLAASLSKTEKVVVFDPAEKRFRRAHASADHQLKRVAPEGFYVSLKNPASDDKQPPEKERSVAPPLDIGRKVNMAGPVTFALWPGQMADVIQGHHLRQDEYLIGRVYDSAAAQESYEEGIAVAQDGDDTESTAHGLSKEQLTTGKLFIIQGTRVSFYIPPTGIEILRSKETGECIQNAVSLERLEYCLLLDQNGSKRYVQGPSVVFPCPTEEWVEDEEGSRKFRAIELGITQGIYVKVIADYKDEEGTEHKAGEELFITGEATPIYFPREEHAVIKYGDRRVHCGVAIPAGEARYVLKRLEGQIELKKGPSIFLPDPRTELVVRRVLPPRLCGLMYPGNEEALALNVTLSGSLETEAAPQAANALMLDGSGPARGMSGARTFPGAGGGGLPGVYTDVSTMPRRQSPSSEFTGDSVDREGQFSQPRSITLDSKFEGAVGMTVWEGYAVMLADRHGNRRVVQGPETALLEYDEIPHVLTLSSGRPKNTDTLRPTVYLKVQNNYVTDIIHAETKDYCRVEMKLTYRLNFEGDPEKWFSVENYVKLLSDHMRSMVRNEVRKHGVKEFYQRATDILRDLILGASEEGDRPGRSFPENGMRILDVEVLQVALPREMQTLLEAQEHATIRRELQMEEMEAVQTFTEKRENHVRNEVETLEKTRAMKEGIARGVNEDAHNTAAALLAAQQLHEKAVQEGQQAQETRLAEIAQATRERTSADAAAEAQRVKAVDELRIAFMEAEATATKTRMESMSPQLVAALQAVGDQATIVQIAEAMSAQGLIKTVSGTPVAEVLSNILKGSPLGDRLPAALGHVQPNENGNGKRKSKKAAASEA